MNAPVDIAAYDRRGNLVVVVEVRARPSGDLAWAEQFRRNLLDHAAVPDAPYFVIVTQDVLYLWEAGAENEPPASITTAELFRPYVDGDTRPLPHEALTLVTSGWLWDLTRKHLTRTAPPDPRISHIAAALEGGSVQIEAAA